MATNLDIITTAYRITNLINENEPPSSEIAAEGLEAMNDLLAAWDVTGIELGYFPQTNLAATSPLQDSDLMGVKYNLAVVLAGRKSIPLSGETLAVASAALKLLSKTTVEMFENSFDHMPSGRQRTFNITDG